MEHTTDRLHSIKSATQFLGGVGESTVRGWLTEGKLTRVKVGRLTRVWERELLALIKPQHTARKPLNKPEDRAEVSCSR